MTVGTRGQFIGILFILSNDLTNIRVIQNKIFMWFNPKGDVL